jgi:hypothetical protein
MRGERGVGGYVAPLPLETVGWWVERVIAPC